MHRRWRMFQSSKSHISFLSKILALENFFCSISWTAFGPVAEWKGTEHWILMVGLAANVSEDRSVFVRSWGTAVDPYLQRKARDERKVKSPSVCGPGTHRNLFCSQGANWTCLGQKHKGVGSPGRMLPRDGSKRGVQLMIVSPDLLSTQGLKCCLSSGTHCLDS